MKLFKYLAFIMLSLGVNTAYAQSMQDYQQYLNSADKISQWDNKQHDKFAQKSWQYWMSVKEQVNATPAKFSALIAQYHQLQAQHPRPYNIDLNRFKSSIEQFERFDNRNSPINNATLFVGSSSIVYWKTAQSFPEYAVINRGFGGASIGEIEYFYEEVIKRHNPKNVVLYSDIDIENGVEPAIAVTNQIRLITRIEQDFPNANILILDMKPTLVDFILGKHIRDNKAIANKLLVTFAAKRKQRHYIDVTSVMLKPNGQLNASLFLNDGMHMNDVGYQQWRPLITDVLQRVNATKHQ